MRQATAQKVHGALRQLTCLLDAQFTRGFHEALRIFSIISQRGALPPHLRLALLCLAAGLPILHWHTATDAVRAWETE